MGVQAALGVKLANPDRQVIAFVATDITDPDIDFCQVAKGFGVWAKKVTLPGKIKAVLAEALKLGKPAVIEVSLT